MKNLISQICISLLSFVGLLSYGQSLQLVDFDMNPEQLVDLNGTLFFKSGDSPLNMKLWKSDGTKESTVPVSDITLGYSGERLVCTNKTLFFGANDGTNGFELWKSDGTKDGTVLVKDIIQGENSSSPSYLTVVEDVLYFSADDGKNGLELWKSDGTAEGTVIVKDIKPGVGNSSPRDFGTANGKRMERHGWQQQKL
jgi:ELWxxDGT repeat protein